jgi:hypothetical protein
MNYILKCVGTLLVMLCCTSALLAADPIPAQPRAKCTSFTNSWGERLKQGGPAALVQIALSDLGAGFAFGRFVHLRGKNLAFADRWYLLGPFDNAGRANIENQFPPETLVDSNATYVGSDDFSKLWIEDQFVWASGTKLKPWRVDEGFRKVRLKQGVNRVLFRVENGHSRTEFSQAVCGQ